MIDPKSAWLAFGLLVAIGAAALAITMWPTPAITTPAQSVVAAEPVDDVLPKPTNGLELFARAVVDPDPALALRGAELRPDPPPDLRGAELPADPTPAAPIATFTSRHWHDARADIKTTGAAPPIRKPKNSKAEMRGKPPEVAANTRACSPSTAFESWLRKLNLSPRCSI